MYAYFLDNDECSVILMIKSLFIVFMCKAKCAIYNWQNDQYSFLIRKVHKKFGV